MITSDHLILFIVLLIFSQGSIQTPRFTVFLRETQNCECGQENDFAPRIVGGNETEPHLYPWMVAILEKGKIHCGGTLINDRYILTAGHCLNWVKKKDLKVILGLHDRMLMKTHGFKAKIEKIIVHEDFSSDYLHDTYDIGLIKLQNPVNFSAEIRPICLPKTDDTYAEKEAMVTGWGRISETSKPSMILRKAHVTVLENNKCKTISPIGEHIVNSMLCAYQFEADACQGDSGGPLIIATPNEKTVQIGIVSWGIGCASPGVPGVYTRVSSFIEWIVLHTSDALYCKN